MTAARRRAARPAAPATPSAGSWSCGHEPGHDRPRRHLLPLPLLGRRPRRQRRHVHDAGRGQGRPERAGGVRRLRSTELAVRDSSPARRSSTTRARATPAAFTSPPRPPTPESGDRLASTSRPSSAPTPRDVRRRPYRQTYGWDDTAAATGTQTVTATNGAGLHAHRDLRRRRRTSTPPTGGSIVVRRRLPDAIGSVSTLDTGADAGCRPAPAGMLLQRASATARGRRLRRLRRLRDDRDRSRSPTTTDRRSRAGNCYATAYVVADRVGNQAIATSHRAWRRSTRSRRPPPWTTRAPTLARHRRR